MWGAIGPVALGALSFIAKMGEVKGGLAVAFVCYLAASGHSKAARWLQKRSPELPVWSSEEPADVTAMLDGKDEK
jgi:hypothetical protein